MKFAVIDLANLFYRCQHVTQGDAFTKSGMALHIIFRSLRKLHREMKVDHLVFCTEGKSWRHNVYPKYKAARRLARLDQTPREKEEAQIFFDTLDSTINYFAEKTRCTVLNSQGIEGDDFIARWIQLHPNDEHVILSGDSDFIQLLAPNVTILDGVTDRHITQTAVYDIKGEPLVFGVDPSKGKIKVKDTIDNERKKHVAAEREKEKLHIAAEKERAKAHMALQKLKANTDGLKPTSYVATPYVGTEFEFKIEPEWWRKALFIKIVRGDPGDGIFPSYPGVRYEGSAKKTGIREAWEDRNEGGYHWNNFMLSRWDKLMGIDDQGEPIKKSVRVLEEFAFNEMLIDLTKQPEEIKELMDTVIVQSVQKEPVGNIGIHFLRFCAEHQLDRLSKEATDHASYLNSAYAK